MNNQQHPMLPPNILLNNWESDWFDERENVDVLLIQAYQAGADAELEACCDALNNINTSKYWSQSLRAARRPKLSTLKEQALEILGDANLDSAHYNIILRALEALPND